MPKELKKRGRRAAKRQKLDHNGDDESPRDTKFENTSATPSVALGTQAFVSSGNEATNAYQLPYESAVPAGATFYGLLDEQESEYFRKADEMLEANAFGRDEERQLFIGNVLQEIDKKELKLACSQGCSRLLEKLIILSPIDQIKKLFQRFSGHFVNLLTHRFASHCSEALFVKAAEFVNSDQDIPQPQEGKEAEVYVSMENLFLFTVSELEGSIDELLMDQFASHVLRVLFVVLSGAPLESGLTKSVVSSKKKEGITLPAYMLDVSEAARTRPRTVPDSFREILSKIINSITQTIDRENIRTLATHRLGSPTLSLLIELDLGRSRKYKTKIEESLVGKLLLKLPDEEERDTDATKSFVKSLLQDPVGSHVLETVIRCVPKRNFVQIYTAHFQGQLGKLAKDEISSYIVRRLLEKMDANELKAAEEELRSQIPVLVEHNRVALIRTIVETCRKQNVNVTYFYNALFKEFGTGMDSQEQLLFRMLKLTPEELEGLDSAEHQRKEKQNPALLHASLLVQSLLEISSECASRICDSITSLPNNALKQLCKHQTASHVIQKSLISEATGAPYNRKVISMLSGNIVELAIHPIGSHIIDAIWEAAVGLKVYKMRVAQELAISEPILRNSFFGRAVWRNWKMDLFKTRQRDWTNLDQRSVESSQSAQKSKSAIQLASERHAAAATAHADSDDRKNGVKRKLTNPRTTASENVTAKTKTDNLAPFTKIRV